MASDPSHDPTQTGQPDTVDERRGRPSDSQLTGLTDYRLGEVIGSGGMGEVVQARDTRIGRDVAIKRMRDDEPSPEKVERFLREAKIQARLDHPAIVPVHELGFDANGKPYFTMKRLAGVTLTSVLQDRSATQQRLLRALVDVCNAIDLAHARGIVHRDLKPSNIMLGDYGEVYVIDWGVARVLGTRDSAPAIIDLDTPDGSTATGQMLGTPGYMAPEQIQGRDVGPTADVYALGTILFEILAGERLHPSGAAALLHTVGNVATSPTQRRPELAIAPELETLCVAALRQDPATRPSAHDMGAAIQRFLDGDRDVERRRVLARELLDRARALHREGRSEDRSEIVQLSGRALALDPEYTDAARFVAALLLEVPAEMPTALVEELRRVEIQSARERSRHAIGPFFAFFVVMGPLVFLLPVTSWPLVIGLALVIGGVLTTSLINWRVRHVAPWIHVCLQLVAAVLFSQVSGPLILTPCLIVSMMFAVASMPGFSDRSWLVMMWTAAAAVIPLALEATGVFAPSWWVTDQGLVTNGTIFESTRTGNLIVVGANVVVVLLVARFFLRVTRDRLGAERKLQQQAWHLRQLLPQAK